MALNNLPFASISDLAKAYRSGELSPVEVTRHMIERIERLDPALRSFTTVTPEIALEQARKAEADFGRGEMPSRRSPARAGGPCLPGRDRLASPPPGLVTHELMRQMRSAGLFIAAIRHA